jgi:hypothetical protein
MYGMCTFDPSMGSAQYARNRREYDLPTATTCQSNPVEGRYDRPISYHNVRPLRSKASF